MWTDEQLKTQVEFYINKDQRKIINEALDFYIRFFGGEFQSLGSLMVRNYYNKFDMRTCNYCTRLLRYLERAYFAHITFDDIGKCKFLIKINNINNDIEHTKTNFKCSVQDSFHISQSVLDFYIRVLMGQFNMIDEHMRLYLYWDQIKNKYDSELVKMICGDLSYNYFNLGGSVSYGICNPELSINSKKAYEIQGWIENDIFGYFKMPG